MSSPPISLPQRVEAFIFRYGTETLTIAPAAVIICAIWGKEVCLLVATATALICYVHWDKIVEIKTSKDWFYMLVRSIAFPASCLLFGAPGIAFGTIVHVGGNALEMWEHKRLQEISQQALVELTQANQEFQARNREFERQTAEIQAILARMPSRPPNIDQQLQPLSVQLDLLLEALQQQHEAAVSLEQQLAEARAEITRLQTEARVQLEEHLQVAQFNLATERRLSEQN